MIFPNTSLFTPVVRRSCEMPARIQPLGFPGRSTLHEFGIWYVSDHCQTDALEPTLVALFCSCDADTSIRAMLLLTDFPAT